MKTAKSQNRVPNETKSLNCGVWEICEVASSWDSANGTVAPGDPVEQCNVAEKRDNRNVAKTTTKNTARSLILKKKARSQKRNLEETRKFAETQP